MTQALKLVNLTQETVPAGSILARVEGDLNNALHLDEKIAVREARFLTPKPPDHIFFRRFSDGRSSQIAAYVVDNAAEHFSNEEIAELHRNIWLSGHTPLLYVEEQGRVDIYSCTGSAHKNKKWTPTLLETISLSAEIAEAKKIRRFSAFRLIDGTFWEDEQNAGVVNPNKSAHRTLIAEVELADKKLGGENNPAARHLLLLTLLLKYLEDREVFPPNWFSTFHPDSPSCLHVFKYGGKNATLSMFQALEKKFNGDIFQITPEHETLIDNTLLQRLTDFICKDLDSKTGQFYLWEFYSFKHIPVEVLSHIYQNFSEIGKGAIFTPLMIVNLMLDHVMPLASIKGNETVLDPSCGSGIFLVSAFRRLVHAWSNTRNWRRPTPKELTELLSQTIFGIELQSQAAELASFSLALAVCDALQPEVIWEQLRFDNLLDKNIFQGDYCEYIENAKAKTAQTEGFDIIIGNPPFMSKLTQAMLMRSVGDKIPDNQAAYFFLIDCATKALRHEGKICMLQNAGFLYNEKSELFRKNFFSRVQVDEILDFVSIRGLFQGADTKVIAILAKNKNPASNHTIQHLTFRRTLAADRFINFDLDYYDYHKVGQDVATQRYWPWRANLLGGGRLFHLAQRLSQITTLENYITRNDWDFGEGFIAGVKKARKAAPWLTGKPLLLTEEFTQDYIDQSTLSYIPDEQKYFDTVYSEERFSSPLILIKENAELYCAYWDNGPLAYRAKILGIHSPVYDADLLKDFYKCFIRNKNKLKASCYLLGTQILVGKATVPDKLDICRLPWPENGEWDLATWEEEMLDDVAVYMADYVRLGQDSSLLGQISDNEIHLYVATFLRLIQKLFPKVEDAGHGLRDGLMYQAFRFKESDTVPWLFDDWAHHARAILFSSQGDSDSFCNTRILRLYDKDTLILIKPDRLRYWIRSAAIRDVDDTLGDMMEGDEQDA